MSIAFATGPYLAVQILYLTNPGLEFVQCLCGILHLLTVLPVLVVGLPAGDMYEDTGKRGKFYIVNYNNSYPTVCSARRIELPNMKSFVNILKDTKMVWSLVFVVVGF
jgi:hypothetical protein